MEIFKAVWNNWSLYQKTSLTVMFLLILLVVILGAYYITKRKNYLYFSCSSLLSSAFLTIVAFLILNLLFKITVTYIYLLTPIIVLTINVIHIGMSVGFFTSNKMQKHPDMEKVKKEFLKDSFQISIFIVLLLASFLIYLSGIPFTFILLTGLLVVAMTWVNYLLISLFFKGNE